jgi:primosomal protein N' (replication factor Y)
MPTSEAISYHGVIYRVAVPSPLRRVFDYLPPAPSPVANPAPGTRVMIPFGNRKLVAVLLDITSGSALSKERLKPVTAILDEQALYSAAMLRVLLWAASYYQHPVGEVFATALPSRLRTGKSATSLPRLLSPREVPVEPQLEALGRARQQRALLQFIADNAPVNFEQCRTAGFSQRVLQDLLDKNLLTEQITADPALKPFTPLPVALDFELTLNKHQTAAFSAIVSRLESFACLLLDGVTGSGKTEVYMRAMQAVLQQGRQCLILVPEIGLTPQTLARFEQRFSCPVVSLHSGLTDTERARAWNLARSGAAGIVIGTRSAIFVPLARPGLIVIDEEHDASFKQQEGFRYSARDLAIIRGREENICVVLGSATPSLESLQNANAGKFTHLQLSERAGTAEVAEIEIIDVGSQLLTEGFSEMLLFKIGKHLDRGNQVLVFINRRGFAPVLTCQSCGWIAECASCVAQLTVHSKPASLRCHHCGGIHPLPPHCPQCQGKQLTTYGMGTQKIETFLSSRFPDIPVLRVDRDSVRSKSKLQQLFDRVHEGEPCILVGTQMLAKGHHFPKISLAAILDADVGLFSADFRGQEHMAQTIIQVAGRAGRAEHPGEVLIQSRHATHSTLQSLARGNYAEFAALLLEERKQAMMPPHAHLALIRAEAAEMMVAIKFLQGVRQHADNLCADAFTGVMLIGPLPAPMEKRAGRYRTQLLLRSPQRGALQDLLTRLCHFMENCTQPAKLRWSVDVDPQDLI